MGGARKFTSKESFQAKGENYRNIFITGIRWDASSYLQDRAEEEEVDDDDEDLFVIQFKLVQNHE